MDTIINVGIKTFGKPILEKVGDKTLLCNMLIGDGFHWQSQIKAILPGEITILDQPSESLPESVEDNVTLVNTLPLETYLECVVGSEMNPEAPIEFLKAHAVISRSWALGKILGVHPFGEEGKENDENRLIGWDDTSSHQGFHVCSDDHCQRYQGLQTISQKALEAINSTTGEVLVDRNGSLVDARFSKCCGGKTELFSTCWQSFDVNCLESVEDPWCNLSGMPKEEKDNLLSGILKNYDVATQGYGYRWETQITKSEVRENLQKKFGRNIGEIRSMEPMERGESGRIRLLRIHGTKGYLDLGKELWIRRLLSPTHLYSSAFGIDDRGEHFLISGKGWGHGVGLCQIGAANMGARGYSYKEILSFYYPGSHLRIKKNA